MLYQIAKEALDHQIQYHHSTAERLVDVAIEIKKQFKRILEVYEKGEEGIKKMKSLASATGVLYTETCLHKYQWLVDDTNLVSTTLDLPPNVYLPNTRTYVDILPSIPSEPQLDAMTYAREFKEEYLKTHKWMNWKVYYRKELAEFLHTKTSKH